MKPWNLPLKGMPGLRWPVGDTALCSKVVRKLESADRADHASFPLTINYSTDKFLKLWIYENQMWTADRRIIWRKIMAVIYTTFAVAKRKSEKNSRLFGIRTVDLCYTGAALYQRILIVFRGRRNQSLRNDEVSTFAKNYVTSDCSQIWHKGS